MIKLDEAKIMETDISFVLYGRVPDEGACVELGIAHTHRRLGKIDRLLVDLYTDARAAFLGSKLNPTVRVPLDRIAEDEDSLMEILDEYRAGRESSC